MAKTTRVSIGDNFDFSKIDAALIEQLTSVKKDIDSAGKRLTGNNQARVTVSNAKLLKALTKDLKAEFVRELTKGANAIETEVRNALISNIESKIWPWSTAPSSRIAAKKGILSEGSGLRDIVDSGDLRNSNVINIKYNVNGFKIEVRNTQKYSGIVHWGGYIRPYGNMAADKVYVQGRPWVALTLGVPVTGSYSKPSNLVKVDIEGRITEIFVTALSNAVRNSQ